MKPFLSRTALNTSMTLCVLFAAAIAYLLMNRGPAAANAASTEPIVARGPQSQHPVTSTPPAFAARSSDAPLEPLQLSPERLQQIGVTTALVQNENVNDTLRAPGNVDLNEQSLAYVQTRFPGWIQNVFANATYQYVHKGQKLFTVYSPDLVSTQQEYLLARENNASTSEQQMPGMAAKESGWLLAAAEQRMNQFGVPAEVMTELKKTGKVQRDIAIESPASGYIIERTALPNAYVQPETKLYTIADLSTVWVYANVFQNDVGRLKPGDTARVSLDAYPGRQFSGRIDQILPQMDATTHTVRVRLVLRNPGVILKPGMYVNVDMLVPLGKQVIIPASAALHAGTRTIAFVDHGQGNLEPRSIETGPQVDDSVVVLKGLQPGERVVSSANFLLDSEAQLQASAAGATPYASQTAPASAPASTAQIDFSTKPAPPVRGNNTLHVKLAGADGKPITDAQVSATFFMPAMPEMGMAAMRATAKLDHKGNGIYEGPLQLASGGKWQVTVTAQRGAQVIAKKQLSVMATGGM